MLDKVGGNGWTWGAAAASPPPACGQETLSMLSAGFEPTASSLEVRAPSRDATVDMHMVEVSIFGGSSLGPRYG